MECSNGCAAPMKVIHVDRIVYRSDEPLVIGNLEIYVCPECGFESIPLKSARIVEDVLNARIKPSGRFSAPFFQPAAPILAS